MRLFEATRVVTVLSKCRNAFNKNYMIEISEFWQYLELIFAYSEFLKAKIFDCLKTG